MASVVLADAGLYALFSSDEQHQHYNINTLNYVDIIALKH